MKRNSWLKVTDPTPAPPLEGRGTAAALSATGARRHIPDLWSPIPADAPTRSLSRCLSPPFKGRGRGGVSIFKKL